MRGRAGELYRPPLMSFTSPSAGFIGFLSQHDSHRLSCLLYARLWLRSAGGRSCRLGDTQHGGGLPQAAPCAQDGDASSQREQLSLAEGQRGKQLCEAVACAPGQGRARQSCGVTEVPECSRPTGVAPGSAGKSKPAVS